MRFRRAMLWGVILAGLLAGRLAAAQVPPQAPEPQVPPAQEQAAPDAGSTAPPPAVPAGTLAAWEWSRHVLGLGFIYTAPTSNFLRDLTHGFHIDYTYNHSAALQSAVVLSTTQANSIFDDLIRFPFPWFRCEFGTLKRSLTVSVRYFPYPGSGWYVGGGGGVGSIEQGLYCIGQKTVYSAQYVPVFVEGGWQRRSFGGSALYLNAYYGPQRLFHVRDETGSVYPLASIPGIDPRHDLNDARRAHYGVAFGIGTPLR